MSRTAPGWLLLLAACGPTPREVLEGALAALRKADAEALAPLVDDEYKDALGDKALLLADVRELRARFARLELTASEVQLSRGLSELEATFTGTLQAQLGGDISLRFEGPLNVELLERDRFRVRSGLLSDLRDVDRLVRARRAALEANDAAAYAALLHPAYKDGDVDLEEARSRLANDLAGVALRLHPSLYKIEVRGPLTHVDEHYQLVVGEQRLPPRVARLTLARAGGRWRIQAGLFGPPP